EHNNFCNATNEETTERAAPAVPRKPEQGRQNKANEHGDNMHMSMLPHDERVFSQIANVIERRLRPQLEKEPADVRMEKTFGDVVRIFIMVDMFVVAAMFARPHEHGIFERTRSENQREEAHRQFRTESHVGKQSMIPKCDAEAVCHEQCDK